jgi:site-specific DNA recombinase
MRGPRRLAFRRVRDFRISAAGARSLAVARADPNGSGMRRARRGDPTKAIAYVRVSTEEQRLGPDAQRQAIRDWATREDVHVLAWHADLGVGGGLELEEMPALVAALGELRGMGAGLLVVAKRDRLARDVAVASAVEREVQRCGGRVVAADGTANGESDADQFMRRILDAAAEYERALIRARTKAALQAKRARTVPFGFAAAADGRLAPAPREQTIVCRVRELRGAGLSIRAVVAACSRLQLHSRAGKPLTVTQVCRILRADGSGSGRPRP